VFGAVLAAAIVGGIISLIVMLLGIPNAIWISENAFGVIPSPRSSIMQYS
jgi:hypothetical protein